MEIFKLAIELILKVLGIFGASKDDKEKVEQAIRKATSDYEKTAETSANVRQSHSEVKSKLKDAWERRWGTKKPNDQNT